jgi:hypothetical protein
MFDNITENNVLMYLDHILDFQLNDLRKASILATANFLVAIGCMNTIEFLGGIDDELLGKGGEVGTRFKDGVRLLQGEYIKPPTCNEETMYELRNSLTHQYVAGLKNTEVRHLSVNNNWALNRAIARDGGMFEIIDF